jgi:chromosome segregation ATPase
MTRCRSTERQALAEAIRRHQHANAYHDRVNQALDAKQTEVYALNNALEEAENDVAKAKAEEGARLVAALVHGNASQEISLAEAEASFAKIGKDLTQARADRVILSDEIRKAAQKIEATRRTVQQAVHAVVITEGGVLELKRHYDALCEQVKVVQQALNVVIFALPHDIFGRVALGIPAHTVASPLADAWMQALLDLETNADAPLPEIPT